MSEDNFEAEPADVCCANCGKAEIDDVKLSACPGGCDHLAKYCSDDCQQDHREIHEAICKERAAKLRDEISFRQPESSHLGDCPICFLPLPIDESKISVFECCGKTICMGCTFAAYDPSQCRDPSKVGCAFCRKPLLGTAKESTKNLMKRVEANDPNALREMGKQRLIEGEYDKALQFLTKATELGDAGAHYDLSIMYRDGSGVEKDEKTEIYHLEKAAIAGNPVARYHLGSIEWKNKRYERGMLHWIIAAHLGEDESLQKVKLGYRMGAVTKDGFAATLRAHQAAVDATKSPQREKAEKMFQTMPRPHIT